MDALKSLGGGGGLLTLRDYYWITRQPFLDHQVNFVVTFVQLCFDSSGCLCGRYTFVIIYSYCVFILGFTVFSHRLRDWYSDCCHSDLSRAQSKHGDIRKIPQNTSGNLFSSVSIKLTSFQLIRNWFMTQQHHSQRTNIPFQSAAGIVCDYHWYYLVSKNEMDTILHSKQ